MIRPAHFTFSPFEENTYVLHDGREAIIVDPGCWTGEERGELEDFLAGNALTPVRLVNTHCHLDHVFGNAWVHERYGLLPEIHRAELPVLHAAPRFAQLYGLAFEPSPEPRSFLEEGEVMTLGVDRLEVLFVPGHAPGHIALFCRAQDFVVGGDVLFQDSIGRTDLPGGDMDTLLTSIREKLFPLGDQVKVYSGHGPETTIGRERRHNPFVREQPATRRRHPQG